MKGKLRKIISDKVQNSFVTKSNERNSKISGLKNKSAADGSLNSGRFLNELNELLLENSKEIYNIVWEAIFSHIKGKNVSLDSNEIRKLIKDISSQSVSSNYSTLESEVPKDNKKLILKQLDFINKAEEILNRRISEYEIILLPLEANMIAKSSKNISIWAIIISIPALVISVISLMK